MRKLFIIQWKSKVNGRAGKGAKLFTEEEANELARELNQEYPQIEHEAVNTEREAERSRERVPHLSPVA